MRPLPGVPGGGGGAHHRVPGRTDLRGGEGGADLRALRTLRRPTDPTQPPLDREGFERLGARELGREPEIPETGLSLCTNPKGENEMAVALGCQSYFRFSLGVRFHGFCRDCGGLEGGKERFVLSVWDTRELLLRPKKRLGDLYLFGQGTPLRRPRLHLSESARVGAEIVRSKLIHRTLAWGGVWLGKLAGIELLTFKPHTCHTLLL